MLTFCTLFNTKYLDKGLVLYDSLKQHSSWFNLYVLAMDDTCFKILKDLDIPNLIPIKLSEFEDKELLRIKATRSTAEYCWTCTPSIILYVLKKYNPTHCTYIDADLCFYSDPSVILQEMKRRNATVQITGHNFYDDVKETNSKLFGRYCVEYNTFMNEQNAIELLLRWRNQCIEYCSNDLDGIHSGDQKYMDDWIDNYSFVIETQNLGAGVAPWNIAKYKLHNGQENIISCNNKKYKLLFYHFQNITYYARNLVNISCYGRKNISEELVNHLYLPYLKQIEEKKQFIQDKYGIEILLKSHPGAKKKSFFKRIINRIIFEISWLMHRDKHKYEIHPNKSKKLNIIKL